MLRLPHVPPLVVAARLLVSKQRKEDIAPMLTTNYERCVNCGDTTSDPYHVLVQCSHPTVVDARARVISQLVQHAFLPRPVLARLQYHGQTGEINKRRDVISNIGTLASCTDWASADGRFTLYHLLAVATWPLHIVSGQNMYLSRALAAVFTSVEIKNHHSRPLSNYWTCWGGRATLNIFRSWNDVADQQIPVTPDLIFRAPTRSASVISNSIRRTMRVAVKSRRLLGSLTGSGRSPAAADADYFTSDDDCQ